MNSICDELSIPMNRTTCHLELAKTPGKSERDKKRDFHFSLITMLRNIDYDVGSRSKTSVPLPSDEFYPCAACPRPRAAIRRGFALRSSPEARRDRREFVEDACPVQTARSSHDPNLIRV